MHHSAAIGGMAKGENPLPFTGEGDPTKSGRERAVPEQTAMRGKAGLITAAVADA